MLSGGGGQTMNSMYGSNSISGPVPGSPYEQFQNRQLGLIDSLSDKPYQPYDVSKMFAGFTPDQWQGMAGIRGAAANSFQPFFNNASSYLFDAGSAANDPTKAAAGAFAQASNTPTGLGSAHPYLQFSSQTAPQILDSYMNPYVEGSVNEANKLATNNFLDNVMPGITKQFIASGGGLGSKNYGRDMNWALTNFNDSVNRNTQNAMSSGFFNSMNAAQTDLARGSQNAGIAGNLALGDLSGRTALGTAQGQNAALGANTDMALANAYAGLGTGYLNNSLAANNALIQSGGMQQQQNQLPLTAAYEQFREGQQYPFQTAGWAANTANQYTWPMRQNTQGWQQTQSQSSQSGSPLGSILGGLASVGSMLIPGAGGVSALGNLVGSVSGMFGGGGFGGAGGAANSPASAHGMSYGRYNRGGSVTRIRGFDMGAPAEARTIHPVNTFGEPLSRGFFNYTPRLHVAPKVQPYDGYAAGGKVAPRPILGSGMTPAARAADVEQSDREYIIERQRREKLVGPLRKATGGVVPVVKVTRENSKRSVKAAERRRKIAKQMARRGTPVDLEPRSGYFAQ